MGNSVATAKTHWIFYWWDWTWKKWVFYEDEAQRKRGWLVNNNNADLSGNNIKLNDISSNIADEHYSASFIYFQLNSPEINIYEISYNLLCESGWDNFFIVYKGNNTDWSVYRAFLSSDEDDIKSFEFPEYTTDVICIYLKDSTASASLDRALFSINYGGNSNDNTELADSSEIIHYIDNSFNDISWNIPISDIHYTQNDITYGLTNKLPNTLNYLKIDSSTGEDYGIPYISRWGYTITDTSGGKIESRVIKRNVFGNESSFQIQFDLNPNYYFELKTENMEGATTFRKLLKDKMDIIIDFGFIEILII